MKLGSKNGREDQFGSLSAVRRLALLDGGAVLVTEGPGVSLPHSVRLSLPQWLPQVATVPPPEEITAECAISSGNIVLDVRWLSLALYSACPNKGRFEDSQTLIALGLFS